MKSFSSPPSGAVLFCCVCAAFIPLWRVQAKAAPPNIIFINADGLAYGDLSSYGQKRFSTPNIDRLAKEGTRSTQCRKIQKLWARSKII